ncbi:MAG: EamA family transporter RarD [Gammaproteobacteria bacterium]|nr:EamA family transporter RarD [Gammaproteobacteria bacterium]
MTINKQGAILAVLAYTMWGLAPIYFKLIQHVPSLEILMHRIIWSTLLLFVVIVFRRRLGSVIAVLKQPRNLAIMVFSSTLLAFNWWLFIWAINNDKILDASLGYYINPLLNIALGMLFLGERLSKMQYVAVGLALTGVIIQLVTFGSFPVVALSLAASFACYGLIRKTIAIDSMTGLLIESALLLTPAIVYWWLFAASPSANLLDNNWSLNTLLLFAGVLTTAPLLCFVAAARRLNYSTIGFFQYIGPSLMFLFGVFVYGEKVGADRWVTFGFIWSALVIYSYSSLAAHRKQKKAAMV